MTKRLLTALLLVCLVFSLSSITALAEDQSVTKLKSMGFSDHEITQMDNVKKHVLLRVYDKYNGTAERLPAIEERFALLSGEDDIEINILGGNVGSCTSGYKCKGITMVGGVNKASWQMNQIETVAGGVAWADDWNYIDYEAKVDYGDFWGNPVTKDMTLTDAVPETGLSYKYTGVPDHVNDIYITLDAGLRRSLGDSGTTDYVGKIGYSSATVNVTASISAAPGITLQPATQIYQKAAVGSFYY